MEKIKKSNKILKHTGIRKMSILIFLMVFAMIFTFQPKTDCFAVGTSSPALFKDLVSSHWAYGSVSAMVGYGILKGYSDGTFRPSNQINRAEFSKIMAMALGMEEDVSPWPTFSDVTVDNWAYPYIETVRNCMTGYSKNGKIYFQPQSPALREDVAAAIVRAMGLENSIVDLSILDKFADKASINSSLKTLVAICVKNGFMQGTTKGFEPKKAITRAEASVLLKRLMETRFPPGSDKLDIITVR